MSCYECKFHGPPISNYTGVKPCSKCIPHPGFPKQQAVLPEDVFQPVTVPPTTDLLDVDWD